MYLKINLCCPHVFNINTNCLLLASGSLLHILNLIFLCFTGIKTSQDARFYALSTKFPPFSNQNKPLVVQFSVKHEQNIDCGGGYVKVFDCNLNSKDMHGETPYEIMFGKIYPIFFLLPILNEVWFTNLAVYLLGPDICGPGTKKVHVIFSYKGKNLLINKDIRCKDDVYTHLYTLIVNPDNTYEVCGISDFCQCFVRSRADH